MGRELRCRRKAGNIAVTVPATASCHLLVRPRFTSVDRDLHQPGRPARSETGQGVLAHPRPPRRTGRRSPGAVPLAAALVHHGSLAVDADDIGGSSSSLRYDPAGIPPKVLAEFPHLQGYTALRLEHGDARQILTGQLGLAQYDDAGRLLDATGVQIPASSTTCTAARRRRAYGVTWHGGVPRFTLWAPTAHRSPLICRGRSGCRCGGTRTGHGSPTAGGTGRTPATGTR